MKDRNTLASLSSTLMLVVSCLTACGEDFRVNNANEFHQRIKAAVKGDKIVLANGQWSDVELVADATGSPDALITVEAEQPGKVIITGNSRLRIAGRHLVVRVTEIHTLREPCDGLHARPRELVRELEQVVGHLLGPGLDRLQVALQALRLHVARPAECRMAAESPPWPPSTQAMPHRANLASDETVFRSGHDGRRESLF